MTIVPDWKVWFGSLVWPLKIAYVPPTVKVLRIPTTIRLRSSFLIVLLDMSLLAELPADPEGGLQRLDRVLRRRRAGDDDADDEVPACPVREVDGCERRRSISGDRRQFDVRGRLRVLVEL